MLHNNSIEVDSIWSLLRRYRNEDEKLGAAAAADDESLIAAACTRMDDAFAALVGCKPTTLEGRIGKIKFLARHAGPMGDALLDVSSVRELIECAQAVLSELEAEEGDEQAESAE